MTQAGRKKMKGARRNKSRRKLLFYVGVNVRGKLGVFAAQDILKGEYLPLFAKEDYKLRSKKTLRAIPVSGPFLTMCVLDANGAHGPANWNQPSVGWYLNCDSYRTYPPNATHRKYKFYASRGISKGDEIIIDPTILDDERYPKKNK